MMRLIIGATAEAVRRAVFSELAALGEKNRRAYLLVPQQFTMQSDLDLLKFLQTEILMDIKVKSFGSLSREVLSRTGGIKRPYVNESGRRMLAQYLLSECHDDLKLMGGSHKAQGVATKIVETLQEFRELGLAGETLSSLGEGDDVPPLLAEKLSDAAVLLRAYEALLGDKRLDNEARLALLAEKISQAEWLRGVAFYLDGFHTLSLPELAVVQALEARGCAVTISLVLAPEALTDARGWWSDHAPTHAALRFYALLARSFAELTVETVEDAAAPLAAADALGRAIFGYGGAVYDAPAPEVSLWKATNPQLEVTYLAGFMRKLVIEDGYRWRDFHITTNQPAEYFPLIERVFKQYEIPVFIDERKSLRDHYLVRYLLNALDMVRYRFSYAAVFGCLQTGLAGLDAEEIAALDYFVRAKNLRGTMLFDARYFAPPDEAVVSRKADGLRARQALALAAHEKFTARFQPLYEDLASAATIRDFSTIVYYFLTAPELLDALHAADVDKTAEARDIDANITEALIALLEQMVETIGEMQVDLAQFCEILGEGIEEASLGILPPSQDQVMATLLSRARTGGCRVQVILGMSDAWLPSSGESQTIFIREEKRWLEQAGISLRFDEQRLLEEEAFCLYEAIVKPRTRLILSYPLSSQGGTAMNESIYVARARAALPKLTETSLLGAMAGVVLYLKWQALQELMEWLRRYGQTPALAESQPDAVRSLASGYRYFEEAHPALVPFLKHGLYYTNLRENLSPETVAALYPTLRRQQVSISELESWQSCPYKHFIRYGIRPEEMLEYTLRNDEIGTLLHGSLDRLTRDLKDNPSWLEWDDAQICAQIDAYLEEESSAQLDSQRKNEARNRAVLEKVRRQGHKAGRFMIRQLRNSAFQPRFNEVSFGEQSRLFPPIYLELPDRLIRIEGRIDRVDTWQQGEDVYVRVIDYKSGAKEFDIGRAWNGLDLQLLLYLRAVLGWDCAPLAAGVFYLSLKQPFVELASKDPAKIEAAFTKQLLMDGVFIDDPQVIRAMEKNLLDGPTEVIRIRGRGKTGENQLAAADFDGLLAHMVAIARDSVAAISAGDIRVCPVAIGAEATKECEYCDYKAICRYEENRSGNHVRTVPKLNWKSVKEALAKEEER